MTRKHYEGTTGPGSSARNLQIEIHPSASLFSLLSSFAAARHEAGQYRLTRWLLMQRGSACSGNFEKWPARDDSEFCADWAISCRRTHASGEMFNETGGEVHIGPAPGETPTRDVSEASAILNKLDNERGQSMPSALRPLRHCRRILSYFGAPFFLAVADTQKERLLIRGRSKAA